MLSWMFLRGVGKKKVKRNNRKVSILFIKLLGAKTIKTVTDVLLIQDNNGYAKYFNTRKWGCGLKVLAPLVFWSN